MTWHWKELLPVDRFTVRTSQFITDMDRLTLTLLYQPLTGALAHSLYVTLLSQLERDQYVSTEQTHRQLMLFLGVSLEVIYDERKKLEAIGLLKTFKRKDEENSTYLYELQPPMTPKDFFENDVLSVYLFNRLGKTHYRQLRERFALDVIPKEEYNEFTHAFDEVYTSLKHSEMVSNLQSETGNAMQISSGREIVSRSDNKELPFQNEQFDFDLLEKSLSKSIVADGSLSSNDKEIIGRLAFVYRMEPLEMSSIVAQVLLHGDELDASELRRRTQEWYKIEHGTTPPALGLRTQPNEFRTMNDREPVNEQERTIKFYETTPPLKLLEIRSDGAIVPAADVKIIESLIIDHKLLPGVVNVLLDFMLFSHDMKLPKALIDKVAGHWSRKKVLNVQEAMQLAVTEQKKSENVEEKSAGFKKQSRQKNQKRDKLPKWLLAEKEEQKKQSKIEEKNNSMDNAQSLEQEGKSFDQMLQELNEMREQKR